MRKVTCSCVASYTNALTRGRVYEVHESKEDHRGQLRLTGDNGRKRWFPSFLFLEGEVELPLLTHFKIEDDLDNADQTMVEVQFALSDGQTRWCLFLTPEHLKAHGDFVPGHRVRFHYDLGNMIIVERLSRDIIGSILSEIDQHGRLLECSEPLQASS